jgi:hypothetical protein
MKKSAQNNSSCTDHQFRAQIQPKPAPKQLFTSFMQLLSNAIRELQVQNQLLVFCLNAPLRPTWGHSMHFYDLKLNHPTRVPIDWA